MALLQWCLPRMGYRWPGFRKVRGQVCKRISRRMKELGLAGAGAYRAYLESHESEWDRLDHFCRITISRFCRDRGVFERLCDEFLPVLARRAADAGRAAVRCWSAGCASGEEPYTLQIIWQVAVQPSTGPYMRLVIYATDTDSHLLHRAQKAVYPPSSLRDMPDNLAAAAFERSGSRRVLKPRFRKGIEWVQQDIREESPPGPFDVALCRNLAFTYFGESVQRSVVDRMHSVIVPGGFLVIGSHENLPSDADKLFRRLAPCIYERMA